MNVWKGGGGEGTKKKEKKKPWLLNANLRKPMYGHIQTQRHTQIAGADF